LLLEEVAVVKETVGQVAVLGDFSRDTQVLL
jgi:hypothetical protein